MQTAIFLDTNVYLHYRDFDQINWLEVSGAESVTVVIPPVIVRELNTIKDAPSKAKVKKRAGTILKKYYSLFSITNTVKLQKNIEIYFEDRDPSVNYADFQLLLNVNDDNLIASMISFGREHPEAVIMLITSDSGLLLISKARRQGIKAIKLSDDYKLPEEPDEEQVQIAVLEKTIRELQSVYPKLSLAFDSEEQHSNFAISPQRERSSSEADEIIKKLIAENPKRKLSKNPVKGLEEFNQELLKSRENEAHLTVAQTLARFSSAMNAVTNEDISEYNTQLDKFYNAYRLYLDKELDYSNLTRRTIIFEPWIINDGTAPAEDIDIIVHFPREVVVATGDDYPRPPVTPTPPEPPKSPFEKIGSPVPLSALFNPAVSTRLDSPTITKPNVSSPKILHNTGYEVQVHVQHIKHNVRIFLGQVYITFSSFEEANSFRADYRILVGNLPNETKGKLDFIIEHKID